MKKITDNLHCKPMLNCCVAELTKQPELMSITPTRVNHRCTASYSKKYSGETKKSYLLYVLHAKISITGNDDQRSTYQLGYDYHPATQNNAMIKKPFRTSEKDTK